MPVEISFSGQVVLITGGATGLGLAMARAFGAAGARVALNDLDGGRVERACAELRADRVDCAGYPADVRDAAAVAELVAAVERDLGRLDVAIANAGVYPNTPFLELDVAEWDRVLDTNLKGVFLTCQAAARAMVRAGRGGQLIALSSGAANRAFHGWAHYCASKAGVVALTRAMALELAPHGIRANAILPGYIDVPEGGARLTEAYKVAAREAVPLRVGAPEDIANAALLLAAPLAGFVTGTTLAVDGGSSAGPGHLRPNG